MAKTNYSFEKRKKEMEKKRKKEEKLRRKREKKGEPESGGSASSPVPQEKE